MNLFAHAARLEQENRPFALAHIVESRGSTPRHSGQMLIEADGRTVGTIGGGMIERRVIEEAMLAIIARAPRMVHGRMTRTGEHAVGSDCGGAMSVYIEVFGQRPRLVLIGGGHVNRALAQAAAPLGYEIHVGDTFAGNLDAALFPAGTQLAHGETMSELLDRLPLEADAQVIIATNHQDKEALDKLIERPLAYLGLLASRRKTLTFIQTLREAGTPEACLQRLYAPIGYDIGAETPEEIAISILAHLLQVRHGAPGGLKQDGLRRHRLVVMRGSGDIASGVALRLHQAGMRVLMLDLARPTVIRRSVAFAQAMFDGETMVEGVQGKLAHSLPEAMSLLDKGIIPLLVDEHAECLEALKPDVLVDAILAKRNLGTRRDMAPCTIALGPGFEAGRDCDAVIETNRGHYLGRVIYQGAAAPNTGVPGNIEGFTSERVIRSPVAGVFRANVRLGELVQEGDIMAWVGEAPVPAPMAGMVRGLLHDDIAVPEGFKIGDIDPRGARADYTTVSDKARAIGGGVLEAILHLVTP
ncbi:selenium-dependent molybdenum cofactor biosynthesis protein YqeB [Paludibacterium sp. B53371]|uniref:selenium-dependent molybdenum cofactor biosynthesis protein YqeB n=1 Tax=Paludibacterium sp. B53371 TaxID=2806263 RepID=UPI001C03EC9E|nr:selenium-dependent molybdenum cofactor biosynthesis protein YqeB [Paludibacterium sp. B53371]